MLAIFLLTDYKILISLLVLAMLASYFAWGLLVAMHLSYLSNKPQTKFLTWVPQKCIFSLDGPWPILVIYVLLSTMQTYRANIKRSVVILKHCTYHKLGAQQTAMSRINNLT